MSDERRERYADAIWQAVKADRSDPSDGPDAYLNALADAAMAVADEENERLRASVAKVRVATLSEAAEAVARYTGNDIDANAKMLRRMAAAGEGS